MKNTLWRLPIGVIDLPSRTTTAVAARFGSAPTPTRPHGTGLSVVTRGGTALTAADQPMRDAFAGVVAAPPPRGAPV